MIGSIVWAVLFAGIVVVEGIALTHSGHSWPSISDLFRGATRPVFGRWLFFALWLWAGWHFFIRGWHFFLRGRGAGAPSVADGPSSLGSTLTRVVLPLGVLLAILVAAIVSRARRVAAGTEPPRRRADPRLAWRWRTQFVRFVLATAAGGYAVFVVTIAVYRVVAGASAGGLAGSALVYGAFLTFVVAVPVFLLLSFTEAALRGGGPPARRPPP